MPNKPESQILIDVLDALYKHRPNVDDVVDILTRVLGGCVAQYPPNQRTAMRVKIIHQFNMLSDDDIAESSDYTTKLKSAQH